ncbi:1-phosphatidylinositol 4,5-bisphosphate phosphodiesterase gamma-1-like [Notothenia coriiceps]|uniref:1-phosphatidylinositol 4,5-bisphosphate phosphodiesterase gamma-1-like n=1 Tax=Notothenia coriiceps TaxID=8208 RepID=A0A6I9Q520_9TELE|nr:PREDICTED: 1-phosphatidylinositol 4,5-bisphosphate phosphodiesterase gamma-1-like [Notothenia coriiceps]
MPETTSPGKSKIFNQSTAHKKLSVEGGGTSKDFRKGQKQGDLEIWDPVDQRWNRHYCVISDDKLYYAEETEEEDEDPRKYQDLHTSEPWFHGRMKEGRQMGERLILDYCTENGGTDGTFLVRQSDTYVTDFTLSFWRMCGRRPATARIARFRRGPALQRTSS